MNGQLTEDSVVAVFANREVVTSRFKLCLNDAFWDEESQLHRQLSLSAEAPLGLSEEDAIYFANGRMWKTENAVAIALLNAHQPYGPLSDEAPVRHDTAQLVRRLVLKARSRLYNAPPIERLALLHQAT